MQTKLGDEDEIGFENKILVSISYLTIYIITRINY